MSGSPARRGLLRGLATLPLIGGSVALIGKPTAAAVPVTGGMLATYAAWLHFEQRAVVLRLLGPAADDLHYVPNCNPGVRFHWGSERSLEEWEQAQQDVLRRAPIVLAAVGCPFTSPRADEIWGGAIR